MKTLVSMFFLIVTQLPLVWAQSTVWQIDPVHSSVQFTVEHLVISEVTGRFHDFSVQVTLSNDDFVTAKVEGIVTVSSLDTGNERRDNHLKSEDFFYVEKNTQMGFKSRKVEKTGPDTYRIIGDLTIRGVAKPVIFDARYGGSVTAFGTRRMGWQASTRINRFDFGLNWNKSIETGGLIAGKDVVIDLRLEFVQQE